jgi:hypothetical protein
MAKEKFTQIAFQKKTLGVIEQANSIIAEYRERGFTLTVRQLYYQFVARDWIKNTSQNYERVASIVDDARKAGLIDWAAIEDRTRFLRRIPTFPHPTAFLADAFDTYAEDIWRDQPYYVEFWIEKDALLGVIEGACMELRTPYFACRGYPSSSELYKAGKRLRRIRDGGRWPIVFYLGDHDPSGLQMGVENAPKALETYGRTWDIEVRHIALTRDQIDEYDPPANYAKESDSRFNWYVERTGLEDSWELDALDPGVIDQLIRSNCEEYLDRDKFEANIRAEDYNRARLVEMKDAFADMANNIAGARRYARNRTPAIDAELLRRQLKG